MPRALLRSNSSVPVFLIFAAVIVIAVVALRLQQHSSLGDSKRASSAGCSQAGPAYRQHQSGVWLTLSGSVTRLLPDTDGGRTHQRFVVRCSNGQTVLIVNDVSVGRRVPAVIGDDVTVRGQYIWNAQGGLIHFTHHAVGSTESGWILFRGKLYSLGYSPLF